MRGNTQLRALLVAVVTVVGLGVNATTAGAQLPIVPGIGIPGGEGPRGAPCKPGDPYAYLFCPPETMRGSSCISHGVLVVERDLTGPQIVGDTVVDLSQSRVWTQAVPGEAQPPPIDERHFPPAPTDPQAHADAQQVGGSYQNTTLGIGLNASGIFSQCDAVALFDPQFGLYTEAYGRGGVADLDLSIGAISLGAEVLDFETHAYGLPWLTWDFMACDLVEVSVVPPGFAADFCPAPFTSVGVPLVTVTFNEQYGPVPNMAGQWVYSGDAMHVTVLLPGISQVDIYVGYAAVAVTGGQPLPPFWIP